MSKQLTKRKKRKMTRLQEFLFRNPKVRLIIRYRLAGYSTAQIAKKTGWSPQTLYKLQRNELFVEATNEVETQLFSESDRLLKTAQTKAAAELVRSVNRLGKLVRHKDPYVAFAAMEKLLEIIGPRFDEMKSDTTNADPAGTNVNLAVMFADPKARAAAQDYISLAKKSSGTYEAVLPPGDN